MVMDVIFHTQTFFHVLIVLNNTLALYDETSNG